MIKAISINLLLVLFVGIAFDNWIPLYVSIGFVIFCLLISLISANVHRKKKETVYYNADWDQYFIDNKNNSSN